MILPKFILTSRQNKIYSEFGLDCLAECYDKEHWRNYPYQVEYKFNSRGFRDAEWPDTIEELQNCVWCFGDSITLGMGSPLEHTWTNILQSDIKKRCINISLEGTSNKWIARKIIEVLKVISPKLIVVQWAYITRDEKNNNLLTDEDRRMVIDIDDLNKHVNQNYKLINTVECEKNKSVIIHYFGQTLFWNKHHIPDCWNDVKGSSWPPVPTTISELESLDNKIINELHQFKLYDLIRNYIMLSNNIKYVPEIVQLDKARDGHHYDKLTAEKFVGNIVSLIK